MDRAAGVCQALCIPLLEGEELCAVILIWLNHPLKGSADYDSHEKGKERERAIIWAEIGCRLA